MLTDLQACCDRKLSKIGSIVEESVVVKTKPIQLMTKILLIIEECVSTTFGTSKEFYGERRKILAGIGQGNVVFSEFMQRLIVHNNKRHRERKVGVFIKSFLTINSV